jgi:hypothetical protein
MERADHLDRITLISGGQTGIDRAMLDFCLDHGMRCGGWCPEGRKAEDGTIDLKYPVKELPRSSWNERTAANVRASDATVILYENEMMGGTLKSFEFARKEEKPILLLDMSVMDALLAAGRLVKFLDRYRPGILNFSGPRHSDWPGGYGYCYAILQEAFGQSGETPSTVANARETCSDHQSTSNSV